MLLGTLVLAEPGLSRWFTPLIAPWFGDYFWNFHTAATGFGHFWAFPVLPTLTLIISLGLYNLITRKRLAKSYAWGLGFYLLVTATEGILYYNEAWFVLMKRLIGVV